MHRIILLLLTITALTACSNKKTSEANTPVMLEGDWLISSLEKEGFDSLKLVEVINDASSANKKLDGIVIARHGKLVLERYYNDYSADKLHKIWSITKPITGTLIGIASDQGMLSVTDSIYHHLENYSIDSNSAVRGITIEHLITMTSGLEWVELGGPKSAGFQLAYSKDWVDFTLSQPVVHKPGTVFNYSTGNSMLLAPILKKTTGKQARDFAKEFLFEPLEITNYEWDLQSEFWTKTQGNELPGAVQPPTINYEEPFASLTNTGSGLRMRPRDLCKFGQLYLNKGKWNDKQVVSEDWINASTQSHFNNPDYGYHWRLMTFNKESCYVATGFGLQRIFVFPKLDLVIVTTQQHYETMPEGNKLTRQLVNEILNTIVR